MKEKEIEVKLNIMTIQYQQQIDIFNVRIDQFFNKFGVFVKVLVKRKSEGIKIFVEFFDEIEKQLNELEERINYVDIVFKS